MRMIISELCESDKHERSDATAGDAQQSVPAYGNIVVCRGFGGAGSSS